VPANRSYAELLKDPRWQRRRLEILQRDGWRCVECSSARKTLHVDHRRYSRGAPWEVDDADLQTLCEGCHGRVTALRKEVADWVARQSIRELEHIVGLLRAMDCMRHPARAIRADNIFQAHGASWAWSPYRPELVADLGAGLVTGARLQRDVAREPSLAEQAALAEEEFLP
jgi:hypothetical protein